MSSFTLPYPPSANRLWRYVDARAIKSAPYRAWLKEAALTIMSQRPKPCKGRFRLFATVSPPDRRIRDIDNLAKPILDAIAEARLIENDSLAKSIFFEWGEEIVPNGRVLVTLEPFAPTQELKVA